jgi:DNA polymerase I-like protein with 3'-5' exonuclease and polymerase domains
MLINIDVKALEWVAAVFLSQDKKGMEEIIKGLDAHSDNQSYLKLPPGDVGRLYAKKFLFRIIFGGSHFANDPDFADVKPGSQSAWDQRIWTFYNKYSGLKKWHDSLYNLAMEGQIYTSPTGREYKYEIRNGNVARPEVLNYPVQGLGADIVTVIRAVLYSLLGGQKDILFINTVHDSVVIDTRKDLVYNICIAIQKAFSTMNQSVSDYFDIDFNLPIRAEIKVGPNLQDMVEFKDGV